MFSCTIAVAGLWREKSAGLMVKFQQEMEKISTDLCAVVKRLGIDEIRMWNFPYCRRVCMQTCVCGITLRDYLFSAGIKVIFKYLDFYTADMFDQQLC